jgi:Fur family transcriptional regulator, ferric uptake regulator
MVLEALEASDGFLSAQQLHASLREQGQHVGLATVYNRLRALADNHQVDVLRTESGEALYRRCGAQGHHHHLRCRRCGSVQEVESADVEAWAHSLAKQAGFSDISHTIEITGLCERCHG